MLPQIELEPFARQCLNDLKHTEWKQIKSLIICKHTECEDKETFPPIKVTSVWLFEVTQVNELFRQVQELQNKFLDLDDDHQKQNIAFGFVCREAKGREVIVGNETYITDILKSIGADFEERFLVLKELLA